MVQINVSHNLDKIPRQTLEIREEIERRAPELMNQLGTQVLSWSQQSYLAKARGGRGNDGIQWAPLKRATLEARVRKRADARGIVQERRSLASQIRSTKGAGSSGRKARLRAKRKELLARLKSLVDREVDNHEIGVDTGLQRSSATPGFTGTDGRGGNVFRRQGLSVTVGYGRRYSPHFDRRRPLLPAAIPTKWQQGLDRRTERWLEAIVPDEL